MRVLITLLTIALIATAEAKPLVLDFSSTAGLERTCGPLRKVGIKNLTADRERVAYVICTGVATAQDAATWFERNGSMLILPDGMARTRARGKLEQYLVTIATARSLLESVHGSKPLLVIEPGNWQIDFNGDGHVSLAEKYFFWVPRRGLNRLPLDSAASESQYQSQYVSPVIKLDQSDVYWAIAYCNFVEAAINVVLAYDWDPARGLDASLLDPVRIRTIAYPRLLEGIRYSMKLRESLLSETTDDREWVPNPRQVNTSFPLVMDKQTFATWGTLLAEMDRLLRGSTLLGGNIDAGELRGGIRDVAFGLCKRGGIDVHDLFMRPVKRLFDVPELATRCVEPTASRPLSGLATLISASIKRNSGAPDARVSGEWMILRYLYWVN